MNRMQIWAQWDAQEALRIKEQAQDIAYIDLNNLYLAIERGDQPMSVANSNRLGLLIGQAFDRGDSMQTWWLRECEKLPGWLEV